MADPLRWKVADAGDQPRLFDLPEREIGIGEFRGLEFLHVQARTIINRVDSRSPLPFRYTINAYRGCSHACSYCLSGDTPILMGDGSTKPLADLRPRDRVYGTIRAGRYRRHVITQVLDHWTTLKRAYRVTLEDGTRLVSSGDHRFLSERGWKHVTGAEDGRVRRPHLTLNTTLAGTGRVVSIEDLGFDLPMFDVTTGTGDFVANGVISHNCFARPTHEYLGLDPGSDFDRVIVVKTNAVERLRAELAPKRWRGDHIAMGTNTDPYQRAEGKYRLTRGIIGVLAEARNPFSILTKGTLVLRDLDVLTDAARATNVELCFSIGTLDEDVWRATEPGTPHPRKRVEAVARLNDAGIPCGVLVAPILPGLSDRREQLEEVVAACVDAGAPSISPVLLHLRPGVREHYLGWLAGARPELLDLHGKLYRRPYAPAAKRAEVSDLVRELVARRRRPRPSPDGGSSRFRRG